MSGVAPQGVKLAAVEALLQATAMRLNSTTEVSEFRWTCQARDCKQVIVHTQTCCALDASLVGRDILYFTYVAGR
eukprot:m.24114 g.24114  ORF g.24114 m.24114 type:complete len:75 (+) comp8560_c0_seq2:1492-1716(+)